MLPTGLNWWDLVQNHTAKNLLLLSKYASKAPSATDRAMPPLEFYINFYPLWLLIYTFKTPSATDRIMPPLEF